LFLFRPISGYILETLEDTHRSSYYRTVAESRRSTWSDEQFITVDEFQRLLETMFANRNVPLSVESTLLQYIIY